MYLSENVAEAFGKINNSINYGLQQFTAEQNEIDRAIMSAGKRRGIFYNPAQDVCTLVVKTPTKTTSIGIAVR